MNISKVLWPEHTYSEEDWNPITMEEALQNPGLGYSGKSPLTELNFTNHTCLTVRSSKQDIRREGCVGFRQGRIPKLHHRYNPAAPRVWPCCTESPRLGLLEHVEPIHPQLHTWRRKAGNPTHYSKFFTCNLFLLKWRFLTRCIEPDLRRCPRRCRSSRASLRASRCRQQTILHYKWLLL